MKARLKVALVALMEAAPVLVVACVVFLLIRIHVLEYYLIPSKSMAPTLHGDREHGDVVLVNKTAYWFEKPAPFDMVVVRGKPTHIVKRMVVLGPAHVRIQEGDLFVGSVESESLNRVVKDPVQYADMRVPVFEHPSANGEETFSDFFRVPPELAGGGQDEVLLRAGGKDLAALATVLDPEVWQRRLRQRDLDLHVQGHMSTRKAVDTSYLDPDGRRQQLDRPGYQPDIGMTLWFRGNAAVKGFQLILEHKCSTVAMAYDVDGRGRLLVDGVATREDFNGPKLGLEQDKAVEVTFGYLDGHCFLVVADELVLHRELKLPAREDPPRENALHFGVAGDGAQVSIRRILVFHDVHYLEDEARTRRLGSNVVYNVPADHMFLLGDNSRDSHDSRDFECRYRLEDLVGRPIAVLAPFSRSRSLRR